jgi:hypothetical protein
MTKFIVEVVQNVAVTVDKSKFTEEFMEEFRKSFSPFYEIDEHINHLAYLYARGVVDDNEFIEGYGEAADMGIKFEFIDGDECILGDDDPMDDQK